MVRRGKIKYKDVVKKPHFRTNKNPKRPKKKTYSLHKIKNNPDKQSSNTKQEINKKKRKFEETEPEQYEPCPESSSESDENELNSLINTFSGHKHILKAAAAVESSSGSDNDDEYENKINLDSEENHISDDDKNEAVDNKKDLTDGESKNETSGMDHSENLEAEFDLETEKEDEGKSEEDPFAKHLFFEISPSMLESLQNASVNVYTENWPIIGNIHIQIPRSEEVSPGIPTFGIIENKTFASIGTVPKRISKSFLPEELFLKSQIIPNIEKANVFPADGIFSPLQLELFSIINNYQDFYFPQRNFSNCEEIRFIYCLHAVNHILKTRIKIIHHNAKLSGKEDVPEEFRDQGLVRPKVLMLLPFKDAAYKAIMFIIQLVLSEEKGNVINKKRFLDEYTGNELILPKRNPKPEDYEQTFQGNTNDDFKIGITVTKKSLKLYADFYSSDIIVASPLGLRTIIGAEKEAERNYDFLASIELLILDQTEIFLMQNWDHILHIFNHLHLQPKESHGTDFSRVRTWSLNGWSKYYRHTLIFSSLILPEINAVFNKKCFNYAGKVKVQNLIQLGSIGQVVVQVPHVFQKFESQSAIDSIDTRFQFFINKILPQQKAAMMKQTLIFIPSYYDYVKIRNYFKKEDIGFVQICEYSKDAKVARARDMFFHGDAHFLLYTERYHFFNRKRIKGIRHIVFYQLPTFPHFYYELCNLMQEAYQNRKVGSISNMSVTVIYSKYDIHQLSAIVGSEKAAKMYQSDRKVHMMVTGGE